MTLTSFDALGATGTLLFAATYLATRPHRLNSDDLAFPVLNLTGALLLVSLSATSWPRHER